MQAQTKNAVATLAAALAAIRSLPPGPERDTAIEAIGSLLAANGMSSDAVRILPCAPGRIARLPVTRSVPYLHAEVAEIDVAVPDDIVTEAGLTEFAEGIVEAMETGMRDDLVADAFGEQESEEEGPDEPCDYDLASVGLIDDCDE